MVACNFSPWRMRLSHKSTTPFYLLSNVAIPYGDPCDSISYISVEKLWTGSAHLTRQKSSIGNKKYYINVQNFLLSD